MQVNSNLPRQAQKGHARERREDAKTTYNHKSSKSG